MKLNILTPGLKTSNGTAFLFPFIIWEKELKDAGIEVSLFSKDTNELFECDFLCIDSKFHADKWPKFRNETEQIYEKYSLLWEIEGLKYEENFLILIH